MQCEECKKKQASITVTTIANSQTTTRNLCSECAKKYQEGKITNILAVILASMASMASIDKIPDITCPRCRMTFAEFQSEGRLGCAHCYSAFKEQLQPILDRIHGRSQHAGRCPPINVEDQTRMQHIDELRKQLSAAVEKEDYEKAAELRDKIRAETIPAFSGEDAKHV